jgi:hypothetical protein
MANKTIKNSMVTREQYDTDIAIVRTNNMGMHVDEINQVVHLIDKSKTELREELQNQIDEIKEKQERLIDASNNRLSDIRVLGLLWGLTAIGLAIVASL